MNKLRLFFLPVICFCFIACANQKEKYIEKSPNLGAQKILAIRTNEIINGMTEEEVKITLGDPTFVEKKPKKEEVRWIYRLTDAGQRISEVYKPESAFPQGIAYIIPFHYTAQEIRIDFVNGKVCQVHEILNF